MASVDRTRLIELFVRGESARLVAIPFADFERARATELLVGALVLRGEFERALAIGSRLLAADNMPRRVRNSTAASRSGTIAFYLSLGFSRSGRYEEAKTHIARLEAKSTELNSFYHSQAVGFLAFTKGDFGQAVEHAREALAWAEVSKDPLQPLARILSLDLLGHSLVGIGRARRGIKSLKQAKDVAVRLPHENFKDAISISILKYEAVYGFDSNRIVARLSKALVELKPGDSYSRSELRLELARQLILRGNLGQARRYLETAADDIIGSQNYLQTAALHLRMAWIARLEKRPDDALFSILAAERGLADEPQFDEAHRDLRRKLVEFRNEILREGGRHAEVKMVDGEGTSWIERRLSQRRGGREVKDTGVRLSEDPFGDLMDRVARREKGVDLELLKSGYLGLLLPRIDVNFSQTVIVLGVPGDNVIALAGGEAKLCMGGFGGILGRLLLRLAQGSCLKKEAIETVWGYSYESERHDRLLMVAISRIRHQLGEESLWIEMQGERVVLSDQVFVKVWPTPEPSNRFGKTFEISSLSVPISSDPINGQLRLRQLQVLSELATQRDVGVRDLVERFDVSRASALRDLNELVDLGFLIRLGETRATRYVLKKGFSL